MSPRHRDLDVLAAVRLALPLDQPAWLVGGWVRDRLLGRPTMDVDLAVLGGARALAGAVAAASEGTLVVLDEVRDIARVVWPGRPGAVLDVAALVGPTIQADLAARDFTVNALAVPIEHGDAFDRAHVLDPTGGLADLDVRLLRMTGTASLEADPLRLLRAVRLAAELGFTVEPATRAAIRERAHLAMQPAGERLREELLRALAVPDAARAMAVMEDLALVEPLLPELAACRGVRQSLPHDRDVYAHLLAALAAADALVATVLGAPAAIPLPGVLPEVLERYRAQLAPWLADETIGGRPRAVYLRLAALLHDVGKPATAVEDARSGRVSFLGHERVGAELCRGIAGRLCFGRRETDYLVTLVRHHLRPRELSAAGGPSRRATYRFYRDTGPLGVDVALLALADAGGKAGAAGGGDAALPGTVHRLWRAWFDAPEVQVRPVPLLRGDELMAELGIPPGPEVGRLLAALEEAQAAGEVTDRRGAVKFVRRLAGAR